MGADEHALLTHCRSHDAWLRDTIATLVRLESPSTDKTAVDACGAAVADRLTALGGRVQRVPQIVRGDHVRAEFFPDEGGAAKPVLLLGHFDTVWPVGQLTHMPLREEDGRLYGPGIFDMKAGIAIAMLAVRAIRDLDVPGVPPVVMLWTSDEEIGSGSSRALIEADARASRAVLVLEPSLPGGAAKTSRKGVGQFELIVRGISAHAGVDPGKGASAIHELAHQIVAIEALQDQPRGLTLNVGMISGGSRPNVVAEDARATIDVRVATMADAERIEAAMRGLRPRLAGTELEITGGVERPPLERGEPVVRLYAVAREAAATFGVALGEGGTGGGSDGNFTAALGVPTLDGLGPAGDGAHARHEHVLVADLGFRAALLAALLVRLGAVEW
jgi:glutamate carboxypeptidase